MYRLVFGPWCLGRWFTILVALTLTACAKPSTLEPIYASPFCYRTLAEADCHSQALAGEDNRLVEDYQAPIGYRIDE